MNLSEFLLARIAEDEAVALEAILPRYGQTGEWVTFDDKEHLSKTTVFAWQNGEKLGQACETEMSWIGRGARDHIARHDPARVLAECEAKRRIVELARQTDPTPAAWGGVGYSSADQQIINETLTDDVLPLLAVPYADHPDYDPAWRP